MAHYIDADRLRAEIERRFWDYGTPLHDEEVTKKVDEILAFLDSIPEQPASEGLEEEVENMWRKTSKKYYYSLVGSGVCAEIERGEFNEIARHFAEWGEKNAYKAIMKKADEVRDKRFDTDYEVKFEPAAGFDLGCVNVYHEGKLVGQYVGPKEEKKLPGFNDEDHE